MGSPWGPSSGTRPPRTRCLRTVTGASCVARAAVSDYRRCCVGLAQFSRPEYGLSGIRGGILGTGRLQHRQILIVGCVPMKIETETRRRGEGGSIIERKRREIYT